MATKFKEMILVDYYTIANKINQHPEQIYPSRKRYKFIKKQQTKITKSCWNVTYRPIPAIDSKEIPSINRDEINHAIGEYNGENLWSRWEFSRNDKTWCWYLNNRTRKSLL